MATNLPHTCFETSGNNTRAEECLHNSLIINAIVKVLEWLMMTIEIWNQPAILHQLSLCSQRCQMKGVICNTILLLLGETKFMVVKWNMFV